jgi:hypothetical protein
MNHRIRKNFNPEIHLLAGSLQEQGAKMFKKSFKFLIVVVLVLALSGFTYAFAAANIVPATAAGDGAGAVTGYTVSAIAYHLNVTNSSNLDSVTFTLSAPASQATIRLVSTGTTWYTCTIATLTSVTCLTTSPQATMLSVDTLQVVASSN